MKPKTPIDIDEIINRLKAHKFHQPSDLFLSGKNVLTSSEIQALMKEAKQVFQSQPMLVETNPPIKVMN